MPKRSGISRDALTAKAARFRAEAESLRQRAQASVLQEIRVAFLAIAERYEAMAKRIEDMTSKRSRRSSE